MFRELLCTSSYRPAMRRSMNRAPRLPTVALVSFSRVLLGSPQHCSERAPRWLNAAGSERRSCERPSSDNTNSAFGLPVFIA